MDRRFVPLIDFIDAGTYRKGLSYTATTPIHHEMLDRWLAEGKVKVVDMPEARITAEGRVD